VIVVLLGQECQLGIHRLRRCAEERLQTHVIGNDGIQRKFSLTTIPPEKSRSLKVSLGLLGWGEGRPPRVTAETKPAKPPDCGGCVLPADGFVYGGIGSAGRAVRARGGSLQC